MASQAEMHEILDTRRIVPSAAVTHPAVFVSDLMVVDALTRPAATKRLHLQLRRGLNVLWARTGNEADPADNRLHGHSAGKTLFCRLLRHVLDEPRYGNEVVEFQIQEKLPEGWVVARVEVDARAWLVGRSLQSHSLRFAAQDVSVAEFFDGAIALDALPPWKPFQEALHAAAIQPLPRQDFPGHLGRIVWLDLLPWLSRDQECRMAKLTGWRATESDSKSPGSDMGERQFLMRLVLGLLSLEEGKEFDRVEDLNRKRQAVENRLPVLQDRVSRDLAILRSMSLGIERGIGEDLFVDAARQALERALRALDDEPELSPTTADVAAAESKLREAVVVRSAVEERQRAAAARITELEQKIQEWSGKRLQALNDEAQSRFRPTTAYCGAPLGEADAAGCELAKKYKMVSLSALTLSAAFADEETKSLAEKQSAETDHAKLATELTTLRREETSRQQALATMRTIRDRTFKSREHRRAQLEAGQLAAQRATAALKQLNSARASRERMKKEIERSQRTQKRTRREVETDRAQFSRLFDYTVREVLGAEVSGRVEFSGRDLVLHTDQSGERTSAAIESIKVVCFDLASIMWSVEGNGWHPRFLIHDSPREADMDAAIYRRFFHLAHALESLAYPGGNVPFQYIITTTEAPPQEMQKKPWLICEPLDASIPAKRLLGLNL